jgi:hypothetical protein
MKTSLEILSKEPEAHTCTDLSPRTFTAACRAKMAALKSNLIAKFTAEFSDLQANLIQRAVDEADALAALTGFPQLLLPDLAFEKVQSVRDWNYRQRAILQGPGLSQAR